MDQGAEANPMEPPLACSLNPSLTPAIDSPPAGGAAVAGAGPRGQRGAILHRQEIRRRAPVDGVEDRAAGQDGPPALRIEVEIQQDLGRLGSVDLPGRLAVAGVQHAESALEDD